MADDDSQCKIDNDARQLFKQMRNSDVVRDLGLVRELLNVCLYTGKIFIFNNTSTRSTSIRVFLIIREQEKCNNEISGLWQIRSYC